MNFPINPSVKVKALFELQNQITSTMASNPHEEQYHRDAKDVETGSQSSGRHHGFASLLKVEDGIVYKPTPEKHPRWYQRLLDAGVEDNGIKPVPVEKRTNTQYNNLFTVFFTGLLCVLP